MRLLFCKDGGMKSRIVNHPILGPLQIGKTVAISVDGKEFRADEGEPIAAALMANGIRKLRRTRKNHEARGVFCGIGRCTDCIMIVNGVPNIRTCITPVRAGMVIETQRGLG